MSDIPTREAEGGCPNADAIMERGVLIPCHQMMTEDDLGYIHQSIEDLITHGPNA